MIRRSLSFVRRSLFDRPPAHARMAAQDDRTQGLGREHELEIVNESVTAWLCRAQDLSSTKDGGVARHFGLIDGWSSSYPETTGYIIPTIINYANANERTDLLPRAERMLDWLVSIQMKNGAFQGGMVDQLPVKPVTFNTGQILLGLVAGFEEFGDRYREPLLKAADWLRDTQDADGAWRDFPSPFTSPGLKVYETHVAWSLLEAGRVFPDFGYNEAAFKNIDWALTYQQPNGWFAECDLINPDQPLTHTIGYVLRGLLEGVLHGGSQEYLARALITGRALVNCLRTDGGLPGRMDSNWEGTVDWVCLTGNAQIASCWYILYELTDDLTFKVAAEAANSFVRRTISLTGNPDTIGGVRGSFPIDGDYGRFEYLNWAAKFFLDSSMKEYQIKNKASSVKV